MSFKTCMNHGFQMQFQNGYMVSVQFGTFNYCERRATDNSRLYEEQKMDFVESADAEVAVIATDLPNQPFVTGDILKAMHLDLAGDGMVCGWVSAEDVGKLIGFVASL